MPDSGSSDSKHLFETARAGSFVAGGHFFELGSRFFIALLLARWLGAEDYGLYILAVSAATLFAGVSMLGLDRAMIRYVAIMANRSDRAGLLGTLQIGLVVSTAAGVLLGLVLFFAATPVAEGLFDEPDLVPLLRLMALVVPFLTISSVLVGIAHGFKRMDYSAMAENVIQTLVRLGLLAILASTNRLNVPAALIVFGVADVASTFTLILLLRRNWKRNYQPSATVESPRRDTREVFAFAFPLWLSSVLRKFRNNVQILLVGSLSVASSVGIYSVVSKINLAGHIAYLAIIAGVRPTLAGLHDSGNREGLASVYTAATRWTLALNLPFFLVILMYPQELLGIFGEEFEAGAAALIVLATAELVNGATGVCQPMIDMTGHTKVKLLNSFIWMALAITTSVLLIPTYGVLGAAISALIAMSTINVLSIIQVWVLEKLFPFDRRSLKPLAAGVAALAAGLAARFFLEPTEGYVAVILGGITIAVTYGTVLMLLGLEEDDLRVLGHLRSRASMALKRNLRSG